MTMMIDRPVQSETVPVLGRECWTPGGSSGVLHAMSEHGVPMVQRNAATDAEECPGAVPLPVVGETVRILPAGVVSRLVPITALDAAITVTGVTSPETKDAVAATASLDARLDRRGGADLGLNSNNVPLAPARSVRLLRGDRRCPSTSSPFLRAARRWSTRWRSPRWRPRSTPSEVTGAPGKYVHCSFVEVERDSIFVAGEPVNFPRMVGLLRSGRDGAVKARLLHRMVEEWSAITGEPVRDLALFLHEVPGENVMEDGEILPEVQPGEAPLVT